MSVAEDVVEVRLRTLARLVWGLGLESEKERERERGSRASFASAACRMQAREKVSER